MECLNCNAKVGLSAIFCHNCGKRLKCKGCNAELIKDAKFCISCGEGVESKPANDDESKNTAKYHRKGEELFCEVSLNNEVAKEGIVSLFNNLASNQRLQYNKQINGDDPEFSTLQSETSEDTMEEAIELPENAKIQKEIHRQQSVIILDDIPHISDVEMTLECSEGDWILIYAFYVSNHGTKNFTKKAVYDSYMAKRKTVDRVKNFSQYWKRLFKNYLSTVNHEEIRFKKTGIDYATGLVQGTNKPNVKSHKAKSPAKSKSEVTKNSGDSSKPKKSNGTSKSYVLITELNLIPKGTQSLNEFYTKYKPGNNQEIVLVIVYYLERILKEKNIGENTIYTALKHLRLPVLNINQTLRNIQYLKGWIKTSNYSDLKITVAGENYLEHEMGKTK